MEEAYLMHVIGSGDGGSLPDACDRQRRWGKPT